MSDPNPDPHRPPAGTGEVTPTPAPPAGLGAPGTGGLMFGPQPSVPSQDLSGDKLLATAPRVAMADKPVPALGGIPLLAKLGQGGMGAVYYGIHPRNDFFPKNILFRPEPSRIGFPLQPSCNSVPDSLLAGTGGTVP